MESKQGTCKHGSCKGPASVGDWCNTHFIPAYRQAHPKNTPLPPPKGKRAPRRFGKKGEKR